MSFPRYSNYKDSGVEWLGQVPVHWDVKRLKHNLLLLTEKTDRRDHPVALENIEGWTGRFIPTDTKFEGEGIAFATGDILFGKLRPYLAKAYRAESSGEAVGDFHVMRPVSGIDSRFAQYQILNREFIAIVDGSTFGSKMPRASWEFVGGMRLTTPPQEEQNQIATFLDRETAKIDELVAEQRRLMELLKEKRQAVISHAVTQGLNPHAPMKPSGIEWLGDVPEHWRVGAIKYFVLAKNGSIKTGPFGSHLISSEMLSGTIKVYNQRSVIDGDFDSGDNFISEDKFAELASFETFPGDLLITTRGTIGRAAILPENAERGILHPCLLRIQPDNSHIDTKFLKTLIQDSDLMKTQLSYLSNATTIEVIYSYTIASVIIPVPPLVEQDAIMQFLADESAKFDTLTTEAQRAIDLLQERRTALISAAVTGKVDVRKFT